MAKILKHAKRNKYFHILSIGYCKILYITYCIKIIRVYDTTCSRANHSLSSPWGLAGRQGGRRILLTFHISGLSSSTWTQHLVTSSLCFFISSSLYYHKNSVEKIKPPKVAKINCQNRFFIQEPVHEVGCGECVMSLPGVDWLTLTVTLSVPGGHGTLVLSPLSVL